ncbi:MAG: glycosyltransferase [Planctomycetota bacterium]|nr:MAG: glycosyltransferase [Planctomycetota bacterium]
MESTQSKSPPSPQPQGPLPVPVLFVITDMRVGGSQMVLAETARSFDPARVKPVVACLKDPGALAPRLEQAGVPLYSNLIGGKRDVRVLWRLMRIIRRHKIRVVWTLDSGDKMFWGRLAAWLCRVKGIVSALHMTRKADGTKVIERSNRLLEPITDCFVAVAEAAGEYLIDHEGVPRDKLRVVYNGIDVSRFTGNGRAEARKELGLAEDAPVAVHVAVFRPEKGHDVLLAAAQKVAERLPAARFLLVGDGPTRSQVEAQCREMGLAENVLFLGQRSDVPELLAAADLSLLTSRGFVETFPMAILEAMASSRPSVCTNVGSIAEMIEDGRSGRLVESEDSDGLAAGILEIMENPATAEAWGRRAREIVTTQFSLQNMVAAHEKVIFSLNG